MNENESVALIRELLQAPDKEELQKLISIHLPRMNATFFSVLADAAEGESARDSAVGPRLVSLAQILLPLRTLI